MMIKDIMTTNPRGSSPATNLAAAAELMLDGDCGILPVIENGKLVGVITDRDMYIALATRNKRASEVMVGEVATAKVATGSPEDDVNVALAIMKEHRVRRLPVTGFGGTVLGIVSMNDIVLATGPSGRIPQDRVIDALQSICAHHHPTPHMTAA